MKDVARKTVVAKLAMRPDFSMIFTFCLLTDDRRRAGMWIRAGLCF
jgi:hypothetical protein